MAEIVNLNRYRKAREKERASLLAESNRIKHGRSKAEKTRDAVEQDRERALLDGNKRQDDDSEPV